MKKVKVKNFLIGPGEPLTLIVGPCVIENESHTLASAKRLKEMFHGSGVNLIFKSSYDKANRSSIHSFRGVGIKEGLRLLKKVQEEFSLPVVTDVHTPEEAEEAGQVCDMLQIPAFLCRQTDLLIAAAKTMRPLEVKKGQFLAPWDMKNVVEKILECGNDQILLVDRGVTFGYNNLVSDMRSIPLMQQLGFPVCFDATHSVQLPGGQGSTTGGQREFVLPLARASLAAGANALFIEAHEQPEKGLSDQASMLPFSTLQEALPKLKALYECIQRDW